MRLLTFQPMIPGPLWVLVTLACGGIWVWYGWRRPGGVSRPRWSGILMLTACGLALVLIILLNPTWLERVLPPGGKPRLTILVDTSASMDTPDADADADPRAGTGGGKTRFEAAQG